MTSPSDPEVVLLFRLRDEVSGPLGEVNQRLGDTATAGEATNRTFQRNNHELLRTSRTLILFGRTLLYTATSLARLGVKLGFLNEEQEQQVIEWVRIVGAVSAVAGGFARMIPLIIKLTAQMRAANLATIALGVSAKATWLSMLGPIAAVVAGVIALELAMQKLRPAIGIENPKTFGGMLDQYSPVGPIFGPLKSIMAPGGGTTSRGNSGGGATRSFGGGGGNTTVNLTGPFMGNEAEARSFSKTIGRYLQEGRRIGWLGF